MLFAFGEFEQPDHKPQAVPLIQWGGAMQLRVLPLICLRWSALSRSCLAPPALIAGRGCGACVTKWFAKDS